MSQNVARKVRPTVESLEQRELMAARCFLDAAGVLHVRGTVRAERFVVSNDAGQIKVTLKTGRAAPVGLGMYAAGDVSKIQVLCGGSNDAFDNQTDKPCQANGGGGNDKLTGGSADDLLYGASGNDVLTGNGGDDYLHSGGGRNARNKMYGGDGFDEIVWSSRRDVVDYGPQTPAALVLTPEQSRLLQLTNDYRAANRLPGLTLNPMLSKVAQAYADVMARQRLADHFLDGKDPAQRVREGGYSFAQVGENVAAVPGALPAETMLSLWRNSPIHNANLLSAGFTETGVGVAQGSDGLWYGVQVFARPA